MSEMNPAESPSLANQTAVETDPVNGIHQNLQLHGHVNIFTNPRRKTHWCHMPSEFRYRPITYYKTVSFSCMCCYV